MKLEDRQTRPYTDLFDHSEEIVADSKNAMKAHDLEFAFGKAKTLLRCLMLADESVPEEALSQIDIRTTILRAFSVSLERLKVQAREVKPEERGYEVSEKKLRSMISVVMVMRGGFSVAGRTP